MENHVNATSTENSNIAASSNRATSVKKRRREYRMHGLTVLKRAVNGLGNRLIDRRTVTGRALAKWRADLIADLGGDVSTQQAAIIDLLVKSKLLLDSLDVWLLTQPTLINKRKKSIIPAVMQRQQLADGLARYLAQLGLERKTKQVSLEEYLAEQYGNGQGYDDTIKLR